MTRPLVLTDHLRELPVGEPLDVGAARTLTQALTPGQVVAGDNVIVYWENGVLTISMTGTGGGRPFEFASTVHLPPDGTLPLVDLGEYMILRLDMVPVDPPPFEIGTTVYLPPDWTVPLVDLPDYMVLRHEIAPVDPSAFEFASSFYSPPSWTVPLAGLDEYMTLHLGMAPDNPPAFAFSNTVYLPPADMS